MWDRDSEKSTGMSELWDGNSKGKHREGTGRGYKAGNESVEAPSTLDRDFERIEEMSVEKALAYESEDIESILVEKMKQDVSVF